MLTETSDSFDFDRAGISLSKYIINYSGDGHIVKQSICFHTRSQFWPLNEAEEASSCQCLSNFLIHRPENLNQSHVSCIVSTNHNLQPQQIVRILFLFLLGAKCIFWVITKKDGGRKIQLYVPAIIGK